MEFESRIQFLGIEEKPVKDGSLFIVKAFSGNEVVEFFVGERNAFLGNFLTAVFADQFVCKFRIVPHPNHPAAYKLKFLGIV